VSDVLTPTESATKVRVVRKIFQPQVPIETGDYPKCLVDDAPCKQIWWRKSPIWSKLNDHMEVIFI